MFIPILAFPKSIAFKMKLINYLLILSLFTLISCQTDLVSLSVGSSKYTITTEEQLKDKQYAQHIEDFYAGGIEGTFTGKADLSIYYKIFKQDTVPESAILISAGRTEAALKYKELIFDLYQNGFSIYIHDHRGQGLSGRLTEDPEMGYVDSFQFYMDDMKHFYDEFVQPNHHEKVYLMAHSMGGCIGIRYIQQYPDDFQAAAFSAPMLGLSAYICPLAAVLNGKEPKYGPGQTPYDREKAIFEDNEVTGSEIRFNRKVTAYDQVPDARLGGASIQWVHKSCKQFVLLRDNLESIQTPLLIFSAENEQVVNGKSHHTFVKEARKLSMDCQGYLVEGAQHELYMESDAIRTAVIQTTLDFYERY
jgi:lysophospholipase